MSERPRDLAPPQPLTDKQEYVQRICLEDRGNVDKYFITAGMLHNVMYGDAVEVRTSTQWVLQNAGLRVNSIDFSDDAHLEQRVENSLEEGTKRLRRTQRKEAWAEKIYDTKATLSAASSWLGIPGERTSDDPIQGPLLEQARKIEFDIQPDDSLADRIVTLESTIEEENTTIDALTAELQTVQQAIESGSPLNDIDIKLAIKEYKFGRQATITVADLVAVQKDLLKKKLAEAKKQRDDKQKMITLLSALSASPDDASSLDVDPANSPAQGADEILVEELALGARSYNCLKRGGFQTLADILTKTKAEIRSIPHLGDKAMAEITGELAERGLKLRDD